MRGARNGAGRSRARRAAFRAARRRPAAGAGSLPQPAVPGLVHAAQRAAAGARAARPGAAAGRYVHRSGAVRPVAPPRRVQERGDRRLDRAQLRPVRRRDRGAPGPPLQQSARERRGGPRPPPVGSPPAERGGEGGSSWCSGTTPGWRSPVRRPASTSSSRPRSSAPPTGSQRSTAEAALTYRELEDRASRLAHRLVRLGVRPGDRVGICVERSLPMLVSLLAVLKAGARVRAARSGLSAGAARGDAGRLAGHGADRVGRRPVPRCCILGPSLPKRRRSPLHRCPWYPRRRRPTSSIPRARRVLPRASWSAMRTPAISSWRWMRSSGRGGRASGSR